MWPCQRSAVIVQATSEGPYAVGQECYGSRRPTIQEVLLGVVEHVRVLEAGELALEPAQVALTRPSCNVFSLLADALLLLKCDIFDTLECPVTSAGMTVKELCRQSLASYKESGV